MCTHVVCVPRGDHLFSSFVVLDHFGWMDDDDVSVREGEREEYPTYWYWCPFWRCLFDDGVLC